MSFTKESIRGIGVELDKVLQDFAKKHNLSVSRPSIRFSASDFKATIEFCDKSVNPAGIDPRYLRDLNAHGLFVGLDTSMIGTMLNLPGKAGRHTYEFVGMRASKAVCLCHEDNKKPYLWDAKFISQQIKLQGKKA